MSSKVRPDQIQRFSRAIRELGWKRQRLHMKGRLQYAYVKGTDTERQVELVVEYDPHMRSVRIEPPVYIEPPVRRESPVPKESPVHIKVDNTAPAPDKLREEPLP